MIIVRNILFLLVALYVLASAYLYVMQDSIVFYPTPPVEKEAERFMLELQGQQLEVWTHNREQSTAVIYFGGNAESIERNLDYFIREMPDLALYLPNYRGFGRSSGKPSQQALFADALEVYRHVKAKHENVFVIGRSLGSGVAIMVAAKHPVDALVLVTPYDSILQLAKQNYPLMPHKLLLRHPFNSIPYAPQISNPTLVIKSATDSIVPHHNTDNLLKAFQIDVPVKIIANTDHITIEVTDEYFQTMGAWLNQQNTQLDTSNSK